MSTPQNVERLRPPEKRPSPPTVYPRFRTARTCVEAIYEKTPYSVSIRAPIRRVERQSLGKANQAAYTWLSIWFSLPWRKQILQRVDPKVRNILTLRGDASKSVGEPFKGYALNELDESEMFCPCSWGLFLNVQLN